MDYKNKKYSERKSKIKELSKKKYWQGVGIIGNSGFGITNLRRYIEREDFQRNLKKVKESGLWKKLTEEQNKK